MQMRQLFQNLLCNALKFSRPGSSPEVSVTAKSSRPGYVSIQIADNGIGFAPEHAERIFEVFERLHGMGSYEGTGIGLAICRRIAERHGGTIEASSSSSAGAVFTVELPLQQKGALA
jgi:signal transduction histidine kinase